MKIIYLLVFLGSAWMLLASLPLPAMADEMSNLRDASDQEITRRVSNALQQENIGIENLRVDTEDGVVTLAGTAENFREIDRALTMVLNVSDVEDINSELTVKGSPYPVHAFGDHGEEGGRDYERARME